MRHRARHGCGPRGRIEINVPEGLFAMRGGRGWRGNWGPFHFDIGEGRVDAAAAAAAVAAGCSKAASFGSCS